MQQENIIIIRQEPTEVFAEIRELIKTSFASAAHSDGDEHMLVDRIRSSTEYIPELALVAVSDGSPVGYILFSIISIGELEAVALAPLAIKNRCSEKVSENY